jgi:hypothetical protein
VILDGDTQREGERQNVSCDAVCRLLDARKCTRIDMKTTSVMF